MRDEIFVGTVHFMEGQQSIAVDCSLPGGNLLAASLAAGVPHYSACGGNGRCSTCRILVIEGIETFGPRSEAESALAEARRWPDTVRLACQATTCGPAKVRRIVNDDIDADLALHDNDEWPAAEEREIALLFCDIAGFTQIAESQLPYDLVHSLNRFFKQIGDPILANGGVINKYLGDGLLALFGVEGATREDASRRAARAALRILAATRYLNVYLREHFGFTFEPRIGLHYGRVLLGQVGHPEKIDLTVIGDAVNTASRIETANKDCGTRLLASEAFVEPLRATLEFGRIFDGVALRGRDERHRLYEIAGFREIDSVYLVQSTFEQLAPQADAFGQTFYRELFRLHPAIEPLFARTDMREMRRMLMRMIGVAVRGLPAVSPLLADLGARHAGYGVLEEYYPIAGAALIHALRTHLGEAFVPEVEEAWTEVYGLIAKAMLAGAGAIGRERSS